MNQKVYYINELGFPDGTYKFDRHRLPQAYMELFPWFSLNWNNINKIEGENNIIIIQTPVSDELNKLKNILPLLNNNKVFITQESSVFDWFDWPAEEQELYIHILSKCTAFCYHSEHDKQIMSLFTSNFIKYPGCINLFYSESRKFEENNYVALINPLKGYQRGMIPHKLLSTNCKIKIYAPKYNRPPNVDMSKIYIPRPDNYVLEGIELVERMNVDEWLSFIYNAKFGVDINRNFAGGNCSLEFGSLGVPLIGNINLDTQRDIFPDLSFEFNDYENFKKVINLLENDKDFYEEISLKALNNTKEKYNSVKIVEQFKQDIQKLL